MKTAADSPQLSKWSPQAPGPAVPAGSPRDFENLVQRFIVYKPAHQFKILSARLKRHQLQVTAHQLHVRVRQQSEPRASLEARQLRQQSSAATS